MALDPTDLYDVRSLLTEEERMIQDSVARFTDERVLPIIGDCFDQGRFPSELVPEIAALGLQTAALIVISMVATVISGFVFARWYGRSAGFGALADHARIEAGRARI